MKSLGNIVVKVRLDVSWSTVLKWRLLGLQKIAKRKTIEDLIEIDKEKPS